MARIKGQEVKVSFVGPLGVEEGLVDIQSFEFEQMTETLQEDYLGQVASQFDDIYSGYSGKAEFHVETSQWLVFQERVRERAQRRTPAEAKFNIVCGFTFPDGRRARMFFEDVFWGALPTSVGSRKDYVSTSVEFKCSNATTVPA